MARVNITTKPGQGVGQQGELFLNTLLKTPVETIETDILQSSVGTIQGVTADAPQAIEGAPVENTLADQQAIASVLNKELTQEEREVEVEKEVRRQDQLYPDTTKRLFENRGGLLTTAVESDSELEQGVRVRTRASVNAVRDGGYKFGMEKQTMEGNRVAGDKGFSVLTSVIANDHKAFDASIPEWGTGYNPDYIAIASAVTEDTMLNKLEGVNTVEDAATRMFSDTGKQTQMGALEKPFVKSSMNKDLGRNINREWKLLTGGPESITDISDEQATVLGDAFLEMYYNVNKGAPGSELMRRVSPTGKTGEVQFHLTPLGVTQLAAGKKLRKSIFFRPEVEPYKTPPLREGEGRSPISRFFIKAIKSIRGDKTVKEAMFNLSQIPHAVVPARLKLITSIILPTLAAAQSLALEKGPDLTPQQLVYANILGFGPKKMAAFRAKERAATEDKPYSSDQAMGELRNSIAQYYQALAKDRKGVNYLTWAMQGTGRIFVEQTGLDPTSSKLVRFALANPVPVMVKPNSRQEANLRQMYAMHLVGGADLKLPVEREKALALASPQLRKWGQRLQEVLDATMSNTQSDSIHQAVQDKTGLKDPAFPQFNELALDPDRDAELLSAIDKAGEDGLLYMDGLMDFAKYYQSVVINKKPHASQFNAYIDGKTNGLAAMGMMIGDYALAFLTGVLRVGNKMLLDAGDIRDKLKETLLGNINTIGLDYGVYSDVPAALTAVASRLFSEKDLNKYTTMTFGYGRALQSIKGTINEFAGMIYQEAIDAEGITDPARRAAALKDRDLVGFKDAYESLMRQSSDPSNIGIVLLEPYVTGLKEVVSEDAIRARAAMKAVAYLSALSDLPLKIVGPAGMDLEMGGFVTKANEPIPYSMTNKDGMRRQVKAQSYSPERRTAAATRVVEGINGPEYRTGMEAVNTSVVAGPQSTDAAVIATTHTGKSMAKLDAASNGNPYAFPIYDALKSDANGFNVIVEESNKNWIEATMDWDVFGEYEGARERAEVALNGKISKMAPNAQVSLEVNEEFQMMGYLTETKRTEVVFDFPQNLAYMLAEATDPGRGSTTQDIDQKAADMAMIIKKKMATDVGFTFGSKTATPQQVQHFNKLVTQFLDTKQLLSKVKADAEVGKAKIRKEMNRGKGSVYQYFAH